MRIVVGAVLAVVATLSIAEAATVKKTDYRYYPVTGTTPYDINQSILRTGPKYGGLRAYGVTSYGYRRVASCETRPGADARVASIKLELQFQIKLPKLSSQQSLKGDVRASWGKFSSFVRSHEETHRSIWLGCARAAEEKIKTLRAKSCSALGQRIDQAMASMTKSCNKKHEAFDAAEQKRLARHPFMQRVRNGASRTRALQAQ